MAANYNIFSIKATKFEQGERDPFGFDQFSETLGASYLPFAGTVAKPSYFLFVAYITHFLNVNKVLWKNNKEKISIRIRLEKLLVYCWKIQATDMKELNRGHSIIGNSFDIHNIDVFSNKGWVKQNAFKIYTNKNFIPHTLDLYLRKIGDKQTPILKDFLLSDLKPRRLQMEFLDEILKRIRKKDSLFNNHLLEPHLQKRFSVELLEKIRAKDRSEYFKYVSPFFTYKTFTNDSFWKQMLDNKKLPFTYLNEWFVKFVSAVDADLNNKSDRILWEEADKAFEEIPTMFHTIPKSDITLQKRIKKVKWFQYNEKENKYMLIEKESKSENRKIKNLWEAYRRRLGEEVGSQYFFNYRHYALLRLLKELR